VGTDDPHGRLPDTEGISDRKNEVTDAPLCGITERNDRQIAGVNLEDGNVRFGVGAYEMSVQ